MIAEYQRDMQHNYLVLRQETTDENAFEEKMLLHNEIPGLLPCFARQLNGEKTYFYDISSRQPLLHIYERNEIAYEAMKSLLCSVAETVRNLEEYLMDSAHLLLLPEFIYMDVEKMDVRLCYYPTKTDREENGWQPLAEFLLLKTDHEDNHAVRLIYALYKAVFAHTFYLEQLDCLFKDAEKGTGSHGNNILLPETEVSKVREESSAWQEDRTWEAQGEGVQERGLQSAEETALPTKKAVPSIVLELLALAVEIGVCGYFVALLYFPWLPGAVYINENNIGIVGLLLAGCLTGQILYLLNKLRRDDHVENDMIKDSGTNEVRKKERDSNTLKSDKTNAEPEALASPFEQKAEQETICGETMLLDCSEQGQVPVPILAGSAGGVSVELFIEGADFTIGKKHGSVDGVISEPSVSRIHAAIRKKGRQYFLEDMNSKNGTYKNNVRLKVGEMVPIAHGDELGFGNVRLAFYE